MAISAEPAEPAAATWCATTAARARASTSPAAAAIGRRTRDPVMSTSCLGQGDIGEGQPLRWGDGDLADTDYAPELVGWNLQRCGSGSFAGLRLRERGRHRGLVGDLAFDLL